MEIYFTFPNTHAVILAEKVLLAAGFLVKVRPIPAVISAGCGLSLSLAAHVRESAETEMKKKSIIFSAVYLYENGCFRLL